MDNRKIQMFAALAAMMIFVGIGCGGKQHTIRSAETMYSENPIKKIAILVEGRVFYPRLANKEAALGLAESKAAIEHLLPLTTKEFEGKGYEVVFAEPVGIGFCDPNRKENWVFEDYENSDKKWQIEDCSPAYEYPVMTDNPEFQTAVRNVFKTFNESIAKRQHQKFTPDMADIEVIKAFTGADTIAFNRIYGRKYSSARKAGTFAKDIGIGVAMALLGGVYVGSSSPKETIESYFLCVCAKKGSVLWQDGLNFLGDPTDPGDEMITKILAPFPDINQPMDKKYKPKSPEG